MVDREGVDALTMRRLGRELGVEAMSLYGYVSSKRDLLDGLLERVYDELPSSVVAPDGAWQEHLRAMARAFRELLLYHPHAVSLVAARPVPDPGRLELLASTSGALQRAGLDAERAGEVVTMTVCFTIGHTANELGDPNQSRDEEFDRSLALIVAGIEHLLTTLVPTS